jgi:hypothetical protein
VIADQPAKNADNGNNGAQANAAPTNTNSSPNATSNPGHSKMGCNQTPYGATGPGANHSGPYDETCDGSPSGNGNGNGQATGKPCAGCVGKADEKNPKGQYPNGSDHNAGYECDRNHGIGRTNPAHTGCREETNTVTPPTCPQGQNCEQCPQGTNCEKCEGNCNKNETPPPTVTPPPPEAAAQAPAPAFTPGVTPQQAVLGERVAGRKAAPKRAAPKAPAAAAAPAKARGSLPFTGTDVLALVIAGCLMLLGGLGVRRLAVTRS